MARPIGEDSSKAKTVISRPEGGWFARIWSQREGGYSLPPTEKIRLGRCDPFTLWTRPPESSDAAGAATALISIGPSRAFTLWIPEESAAAGDDEASSRLRYPEASKAFSVWIARDEGQPVAEVEPIPESALSLIHI